MLKTEQKFDLEERLINFSLRVINTVEVLPDTKICNYLSSQLLRSGTSPALNYGEAQSPESKRDFIHKYQVILKELRETSINLRILDRKSLLTDLPLLQENKELIAIFFTSIRTARKNGKDW